jgi:hypothetical protein
MTDQQPLSLVRLRQLYSHVAPLLQIVPSYEIVLPEISLNSKATGLLTVLQILAPSKVEHNVHAPNQVDSCA